MEGLSRSLRDLVQYDKDQNTTMIHHLKQFLISIQNMESIELNWIAEIKNKVFQVDDFSDKHFLLLEKSRKPKDVIRNSICQYYLSIGYKDIMKNSNDEYEEIHIFMNEIDKLEMHHIVPLGDLTVQIKVARYNRAHILNSPLNYIYITPKSNKTILSNSVSAYLKHCEKWSILKLGIKQDQTVDTPDKIKELLDTRFELVKMEIINHIDGFL